MKLFILFFLLIAMILFSTFNVILFAEDTINEMDIDNAVIRIINPEFKKININSPVYRTGSPWGSGFLASWNDDLFIVTARHVVEVDNDLLSVIRIKNKKNNSIERYQIKLPKDNWIFHPEEGNNNINYVDVAIMKINWLEGFKIKTFDYNEDFLDEKTLNSILTNKVLEKSYVLSVYWWTSDVGEAQLDPSRPIKQIALLSEKIKELKLKKIILLLILKIRLLFVKVMHFMVTVEDQS